MSLATLLVVNPDALGLWGRRLWARHGPEVLRRLAPAEAVAARDAAQAGQVTRDAALRGIRRVIAVGDDETVHGVVNGLMRLAETHRREMRLGVLSLARPTLAARAMDWPTPLERQLDLLVAAHTLPWDVGRVDCVGRDGEVARYFLTGAAFGLPPGRGAGALATAGVSFLLPGRRPSVHIVLDGELACEGPCLFGLALVAAYDPLLGRIAPAANPLDGALDVGWLPAAGLRDCALGLGGVVLRRPDALTWRSPIEARIEATRGGMTVTADGSAVGRLPATFVCLPRALPVIVESVASRLRSRERLLLRKAAGAALAGEVKRTAGS
jgi:diacylglycerol kinase family enzyme